MNISIRKFLISGFILLLFSCNSNKEVKPITKDIKELVFASGVIEWDNSYNLTAQTDGILSNVELEVGDKVLKGKVVCRIDNPTNVINKKTAQEQLQIATENVSISSPQLQLIDQNILYVESKYQQDKILAERYQRLFAKESVSKLEYENSQLSLKNDLTNLEALKKQKTQILQQARLQQITTISQLQNNNVVLNYNKVIIPQNGTIIKKTKTLGDYVKKGDVIAIIANEEKVKAVLNVDENSIGKVKLGQPVYVQLNTNKNRVYQGKVAEILSAFDEKEQSFICKVVFDSTINTALYGTQLEANILVGEKKNALLIPRNYVGFGNKINVKGKDGNVIIKTGIISTDYIEVLDGLDKDAILLPLKP